MPLSCRIILWAVLVLAPTIAFADEQRCALIDIDQSALGGLVEAELLALPDTQWVERTEIQKLLNEQRLQTILGALSGNDRRSIGTVLKADVLIILRTIEEEQKKYAELVVAETNQGIRLVRQKMLLGSNPSSDAEVLAKLASDGIAKSQGAIQHIFAVPPFVSDDLTYEYDYLKSTYAKLVERTLLDAPGVVVVELDEAKAITNEFNLAADGANVERTLPTYVLGEYRNEGRDDDRRVRLSLKSQQGAKVASEKEETIEPKAVSGVLLKFAQELASSQGIETASIDPQQEVTVLNERANLFMRLGNWHEAQSLVEASLLLVPDQPEMHSQAVAIIEGQLRNNSPDDVEGMRRNLSLRRQAMLHLRVLSTQSRFDLAKRHYMVFRHYPVAGYRVYVPEDPAANKFVQETFEFQDLHRDVAMQMVHGLAQRKDWKESAFVLSFVTMQLTPKQRYAEIEKILLKYQELAEDELFTRSYVMEGQQRYWIKGVEGREFLQGLIDSAAVLPPVRQAAEKILDEVRPKPARVLNHVSNSEAAENKTLTFQRVKFDQLKSFCFSPRPVGGPWDLIVGNEGYFLYSKEDGLRKIWKRMRGSGTSFHYDGRYIWVALNDDDGGIGLSVIDPENGKQFDFTKQEGLPLLSMDEVSDDTVSRCDISVAPVGVGRAIVVGFVGRTWFADVTFDPEGNHKVDIFHEAKETLPADKNKVDPKNINIRFSPYWPKLLTQIEDGKVIERGVFLNRNAGNGPVNSYPLLINPDDHTIRVVDPSWQHFNGQWDIDGRTYNTAVIELRNRGMGLFRRGLGDEQKSLVFSEYDEGEFCYDEQRKVFHLAGHEWRTGNMETGELKSLGPVPWVYRNSWQYSRGEQDQHIRLTAGTYEFRRLQYTKNFGVVVNCQAEGVIGGLLLQVLFDGSGVSFKEAAGITVDGKENSPPQKEFQPLKITGRENLWGSWDKIEELAYSPDGERIVSVSRQHEKAARVWNADSGAIVASLLDDPKGMNRVAFSPSGEYFATGGNDGRVIVWDAQQLRPTMELTDLKQSVAGIAFSADSRRMAATGDQGDACVWNVETGKKLFDFLGCLSNFGFHKLAFTTDDRWILSIQAQSSVRAHDANDGTDLGVIETMQWVGGVLPDGSILGTGKEASNDLVRLYPDGTTQVVWTNFPGSPIALSKDGRFIATLYDGAIQNGKRERFFRRVEVLDTTTRKVVYAENGYEIRELAFSPDSTELAIYVPRQQTKRIKLVPKANESRGEGNAMTLQPADTGKLLTPIRKWTDKSGRFHIDAALVKWDAKSAFLQTADGKQLIIPLTVLSEADRLFLEELAERN